MMPLYCEKTGAPSPNGGSCTCQVCWANNEIVRLRNLLEEVKNATAVPLPDPKAHSWSAFYDAAYAKLTRCADAARRM